MIRRLCNVADGENPTQLSEGLLRAVFFIPADEDDMFPRPGTVFALIDDPWHPVIVRRTRWRRTEYGERNEENCGNES